MKEESLIFTASGIRGIYGQNLTLDISEKIAFAFGSWLKNKEVIIGRDTRPSGKVLKKVMIKGLLKAGCNITDLNISPTPVIIFTKNFHNIEGGVIISGSHNPPEWNGIKLLSKKTFLSSSELEEISHILNSEPHTNKKAAKGKIKRVNGIKEYEEGLYNQFNVKKIKEKNNLSVALDTGAGAGKYVTPKVLKNLGCNVTLVNNNFTQGGKYPREIEPVESNLEDLITNVKKNCLNVGFAHDCDADRLAIIGDEGTCYPQDVGLALITKYHLKKLQEESQEVKFITNLASSLRFEALAKQYGAEIIRTPVGERYLAEKMDKLMKKSPQSVVFGGEGSCGGVMIPEFNNARDGIFAATQIIKILVDTEEDISVLVQSLPKYYSFRKNVKIQENNIKILIDAIHKKLQKEYNNIERIKNDLRFGEGEKWFILIHPSNTEPIIRIISEAKNKNEAKRKCEEIKNNVQKLIKAN
ncbi:MAG: hypothetical protein ACOC35_05455 [Promethearchaeia archaeon]